MPGLAVEDMHAHPVAEEKQAGTALVGVPADLGDHAFILLILGRFSGQKVLVFDPTMLPQVEPVEAVTSAANHN